jgi:biopolymer transport protein TolR
MTTAIPVDLPKTQAKTTVATDKEPLVVIVDSSGKVFLQDKVMPFDDLVPKLKAITGANADARIFVRGDKAVSYGRVMEVMGAINAAGYNKVALVSDLRTQPQR